MSVPDFSIVVTTRDRREQLARCLDALGELTYKDAEIIIVDNAPDRCPAKDLAEQRGIKYLLCPEPGVSIARNRGARAAQGRFVAFIDDDGIASPGWLQALAAEFHDPAVMVVSGKILPSKVETEGERLFERLGGFSQFRENQRVKINSTTEDWFEITNFARLGVGSNMAFRRSAFDVWPGFDERIGRGKFIDSFAERKAFFDLVRLGYRAVYTPHAVVTHPYPATVEQVRRRFRKDVTAISGYLLLLLIEYAEHRRNVWRHIRQRRVRREQDRMQAAPKVISMGSELWARAGGILAYLRTRLA